MNLDRPYAPVREGIMDFFPRAAIIPHLEQRNPLLLSIERAFSEAATMFDMS
jgi:hypothetical protein